jgi:hypothetical protein
MLRRFLAARPFPFCVGLEFEPTGEVQQAKRHTFVLQHAEYDATFEKATRRQAITQECSKPLK